MQILWSQLPGAQTLLASCASNPPTSTSPASQFKRGTEMDRKGPRYDPTDPRVRELAKLYDVAVDLSHQPKLGTPEWKSFRDAWSAQYECTVDVAIHKAITAHHYSAMAVEIAA
jgi:hypothetical protein